MSEIGLIGDIHGHPDALGWLLERVLGEVDQLVFLGDYVNRGPDSAGVVRRLVELGTDQPQTVFLAGNHDLAFRDALDGQFNEFLTMGGAATVRSYVMPPYGEVTAEFARAVPPEHRAFLDALLDEHVTDELHVAHHLPAADGSGRFRVGGHAAQVSTVPAIGDAWAFIDTGCGTVAGGTLTCLMWPSLRWISEPAGER